MSRGRKKRGWVYRSGLVLVSIAALAMGVILIGSLYWRAGFMIGLPNDRRFSVNLMLGTMHVKYYNNLKTSKNSYGVSYIEETFMVPTAIRHREFEWFNFDYSDGVLPASFLGFPIRIRHIAFPLWVPLILISIWPVLTIITWARFRFPPDHCSACGYDLRGSKESIACPECGEAIQTRACINSESGCRSGPARTIAMIKCDVRAGPDLRSYD